jgi:hypothetical protein
MNRQERRAAERAEKAKQMLNLGGGYGIGNNKSVPATGQHPQVNPFIIPKTTGLNITTQTFPNSYYVSWDLSTWRAACDQAIKMGWPISYATLTSWAFESSAFIRSLFNDLEDMVQDTPIFLSDSKGNQLDDWTKEICLKSWFIRFKKEIMFSEGWGFTALNFDPINNRVYKYPMQQIDPINRMLRQSTFNYADGISIDENINLYFCQPNSNYESFLGWMQAVTRSYIQMNLNNNNWIAAGRKIAFPLLMVGYPSGGGSIDEDGNEYNPDKIAAENIVKTSDPSNGIIFPYTRKPDGTIEKAIEVEYTTGNRGTQNAHKIYSDFNKEQKDEIREMVFGENMTTNAGEKGSRALGEVHERKHKLREKTKIEFLVSQLNDPYFINKISKFYKNFPKDAVFTVNVAKEWQLEEIKTISDVLVANGKKLSIGFFEKVGISAEDIEENPQPLIDEIKEPELEIATQEKKSWIGSLKKKVTR